MTPHTQEGARLVEAAERLIAELREGAEEADRCNRIRPESFRALQGAGVSAAFVPADLGGLGLSSMHDWILAIATLARGDGSTAIAISMHLSATRAMAAAYRASDPASPLARRLRDHLEAVAAGRMLVCSTTTERGTDNLHPLTEARRDGAGWRISGTKYFVTMSPIATHVALNVRVRDGGDDRIANVVLPMTTPGIVPGEDWDALGMRASGSQSLAFDRCAVPGEALRFIGPWGRWSPPVLVNRTLANVPLVGAFLGIAEAVYEIALSRLRTDPGSGLRPGVAHTVAEMEILLAASQCMLARMGERLDDFLTTPEAPTLERGHELMKDYQSVKWVVNRNAIEIVGKAMDLAGGGGFLAANPLTRLYRDVRAGPFMQPYSPVDACDYVGRVALGLYPET